MHSDHYDHPSTYNSQWRSLQHHLHSHPIPETQPARPTWLSCLDIRILLTALAKQRAEIALLELEASHASLLSSGSRSSSADTGIQFPNYDLGFAVPFQSRASTDANTDAEPKRRSPPITSAEMLFLDNIRDADTNTNEPPNTGTDVNEDDASPMSPTFGPRRNSAFSGTVARRRSLQYSPLSPRHLVAGSQSQSQSQAQHRDQAHDNGAASTKRDILEQRVQFEAAWTEIERNLGAYVDRFAAAAAESEDTLWGSGKGTMAKEDIGRELVMLRERGERLRERIRKADERW